MRIAPTYILEIDLISNRCGLPTSCNFKSQLTSIRITMKLTFLVIISF